MSDPSDDGRGATDGVRRAKAVVRVGHVGWMAALALGLWLLRGSLPALALVVLGVVVLAVGAAGVAAPLIRRRAGRPGGRVAAGWILCGVSGLVLLVTGVVLLVTGSG